MSLRERIAGVDFSGARMAGRNIWIAEGRMTGRGIAIDRLARAADLPGGAAAFVPAMSALIEHVAGLADSIVGFDFPFSLPAPLIAEPTWTAFVRRFAENYPAPEAFREDCRDRTDGRELKRRTDREARVPWCAYNLRLYRQTWAGIRHVLWPLVRDDRARAVPMQPATPGLPVIAETCPASILKKESLYVPYKGRGDLLKAARAGLLDALVARRALAPLPADLRQTAVANAGGDALDAVIAAIGAARAEPPEPRDALDRIEARIFY
ncbi:MAG: hypothetical protein WD470_11595 [Rhodospirillaceae bacterium]